MKEIIEFRINYEYSHLLFRADEGKNLGTSVKVIELSRNDPRYSQIPIIAKQVQQKYGKSFFFGWQIKRGYTKQEIEAATLFYLKVKTTFEPAGEECGTLYDETVACEICGANRRKIGLLSLQLNSIPKET